MTGMRLKTITCVRVVEVWHVHVGKNKPTIHQAHREEEKRGGKIEGSKSRNKIKMGEGRGEGGSVGAHLKRPKKSV